MHMKSELDKLIRVCLAKYLLPEAELGEVTLEFEQCECWDIVGQICVRSNSLVHKCTMGLPNSAVARAVTLAGLPFAGGALVFLRGVHAVKGVLSIGELGGQEGVEEEADGVREAVPAARVRVVLPRRRDVLRRLPHNPLLPFLPSFPARAQGYSELPLPLPLPPPQLPPGKSSSSGQHFQILGPVKTRDALSHTARPQGSRRHSRRRRPGAGGGDRQRRGRRGRRW